MNNLTVNGKDVSIYNTNLNRKKLPIIEPYTSDKLNWLIHLQHVRGETRICKLMIKNQIDKSNGLDVYAYFKQGIILREEGKLQEALDSFQICLKLNPSNANYLKEVARCLYEMKRFRVALEAYLEAERFSTIPDWKIYYDIGQCLIGIGDLIKAKDYIHQAVNLGKNEKAYNLLIKILIAEKDLKTAVSVCNTAIKSCPDSVSSLTESGLLYLKLNETQNAFERLSSALALDPQCTKALLGIGCISQFCDEYDVALTKYKMAIINEPNSVALWNNIGTCFLSKQKFIAAISCLKRALWISPMNWKILYNLGLVHLATSQSASAFNFFCAAINLRPNVAKTFSLLGHSLFELKDTENALKAYKQSLIINNNNDLLIILNAIIFYQIHEYNNDVLLLVKQYQNLMKQQNICISNEIKEAKKRILSLGLNLDEAIVEPNQQDEFVQENQLTVNNENFLSYLGENNHNNNNNDYDMNDDNDGKNKNKNMKINSKESFTSNITDTTPLRELDSDEV